MKKLFYIVLFLLFASVAQAVTTVPLGKNGTEQYLLYPTDNLKAAYFVATSTASSTFAGPIVLNGHLTTDGLKARTSSGLDFHSNSGVIVMNIGAGGGTNATFYGGVNVNGALTGPSATFGSATVGTITATSTTATSTLPVLSSATATVVFLNGKTVELDDDGFIKIYNTSDETTNFQYGKIGFDGSIFSIGPTSGGSAQEVTMIIGTSSRPHLKLQPAGQPFLRWDNPNGTNDTTQPLIAFADTGGMSASAGIQKYMSLHPIFDQTGTASYCVLCIEPYEQTLGSGEKYLILAGTSSGQDLFHVTNIGDLYTPYFSVVNNAKEYKATLMTVRAPLQNPQEATMTTLLDYGSNNKQWIDWTLEDYGTDNQGSINIVRSGTKPLLPFVIRYWDSNLGPVSQYGKTNFVTVPAGNSGFGMGSSTLRTDAMLHISSSTIPYGLAIHGESGKETFTVSSSGETKSDNFTASSSSKVSSFYNILAGNAQNVFSVVGNFVGVGTVTPQTTLDIRGPNISTTATTLGNLNIMATNTQASDIGASITFGGFNDNSASVQRVFASIEGKKENGTTGSSLGYLKFRVNNAGTLTDVARFSSNGNFGIGTTSPYARLSVAGKGVFETIDATSTTATSTFSGNLNVQRNLQIGTSSIYLRSGATSTFDAGISATSLSVSYINLNGTTLDTWPSGGGASWGTITGTLSSQTDLQSALDAKLSSVFTNATGTTLSIGFASSTNMQVSVGFFQDGFGDCDTGATSKVLYDITTGKFSCGTDQSVAGGGLPGNLYAVEGELGIGSSTPWAQLAVVSTTSDYYANPVVAFGRSLTNGLDFFLTGTTSYQFVNSIKSVFGFGTTTDKFGNRLTKNITLAGKVSKTHPEISCTNWGQIAAVSADTNNFPCVGLTFDETTDADIIRVSSQYATTGVQTLMVSAGTTAGAGSADAGTIRTLDARISGTSSPSIEFYWNPVPSPAATNTAGRIFMAGFTSENIGGNFARIPSNGVMLVASGTLSNIQFVTVNGGVQTVTDTGVASTTSELIAQVTMPKWEMGYSTVDNVAYLIRNGVTIAQHTANIPNDTLSAFISASPSPTGATQQSPANRPQYFFGGMVVYPNNSW